MRSSLKLTDEFKDHPRLKIIRFEDFLSSPETLCREMCDFLSIELVMVWFVGVLLKPLLNPIWKTHETKRHEESKDHSESWQQDDHARTSL